MDIKSGIKLIKLKNHRSYPGELKVSKNALKRGKSIKYIVFKLHPFSFFLKKHYNDLNDLIEFLNNSRYI